jgi:hypothetical protein
MAQLDFHYLVKTILCYLIKPLALKLDEMRNIKYFTVQLTELWMSFINKLAKVPVRCYGLIFVKS